ncbi:MAG: Rap1a/Tai family immunity protein [Gammaproteobacteria bacterium]|nr:Rap1a/Tai family immunity protein [Gammaproteobacteria bacterium]
MKQIQAWYAVGILMLSLAMSDALAVEALSTEELITHCAVYEDDPEGEDGIFCVRYIQGFIDGAVATDERVTYNVAAEYDREETFTERAIRTRLGSRIDRYGPSFYAEFCLGEPVPLATVARIVIADLLNLDSLEGREFARDVVYATLRREFPCEADDE